MVDVLPELATENGGRVLVGVLVRVVGAVVAGRGRRQGERIGDDLTGCSVGNPAGEHQRRRRLAGTEWLPNAVPLAWGREGGALPGRVGKVADTQLRELGGGGDPD